MTKDIESILENETHEILELEIETDHQIPARRPDLVLMNKKKRTCLVDFAFPADRKVKMKGSEKIYEYLDLAIELEKKL